MSAEFWSLIGVITGGIFGVIAWTLYGLHEKKCQGAKDAERDERKRSQHLEHLAESYLEQDEEYRIAAGLPKKEKPKKPAKPVSKPPDPRFHHEKTTEAVRIPTSASGMDKVQRAVDTILDAPNGEPRDDMISMFLASGTIEERELLVNELRRRTL